MSDREESFKSKLPHLKTSIFTEMSVLAKKYSAINLSQGFPEFDTPEFLKSAIIEAIENGMNQYAPSVGMPDLITQIELLIKRQYQFDIDAAECVTVTCGATEALWVAIQTLVRPGDEVIVFDPAYDAYEPSVELADGRCVHIPLQSPSYRVNWEEVESKITTRTRAIIINSPHNPTGTLLNASDLSHLQRLVVDNKLYLISDEVYEYMTFDGERHESVLRYPELFQRSIVISSFGKTFHCTGWKLGYCTAPALLSAEIRKIHQYVTFTNFTPAQIAISKMLKQHPEHIVALNQFYQEKRNFLQAALKASRFKLLPSKGTYFLLVDYSAISALDDVAFCYWLAKEVGVAAIPLSPFYHKKMNDKVVRLCFAKNESTMQEAAKKLCGL